MSEVLWTSICFILAIICMIISVIQFKEKGFLFNNAYIWASKEEREKMDKKPHYHQSGIVFALCGAIFLVMGVECVFLTGWLWMIDGILAVVLLVYAIVSSVKTSKTKK